MIPFLSSPRIRSAFVLTIFLLSLAFIAFNGPPTIPKSISWKKNQVAYATYDADAPREPANDTVPGWGANATLGFGAIFVVSGQNSPRRDHLEQAAAVNELELQIPEQRAWLEEDLLKFRGTVEKSEIGNGSIKAWLSHHLALRAFLDSSAETALILEDDVDFDIRLRSRIIPKAQRATRELLIQPADDFEEYPWGRPSDWDLLWLGHCGDTWVPWDQPRGLGHFHPDQLETVQHKIYADDAVPYLDELHPWTSSLLVSLRISQKHRIIHKSKFPLCSFAYAITRSTAQKLLSELAPANEGLMTGTHAWDVALLNACRDVLWCWSFQPELFHHTPGNSAIGADEGNPFVSQEAVAASTNEWYRGETSNIDCGHYDGTLYYFKNQQLLEKLVNSAKSGICPKLRRSSVGWSYHDAG